MSGSVLEWDGHHVTNNPEADKFVTKEYRKGTGEEAGRNVFPQIRELLTQIRAEDDVLAVKDLAVNGNDLLALGLRGRQIGQALDIVLGAVIDERLENEKEAELAWLRSVYEL